MSDTYRGWKIHYDYPPIPLRSLDWSATSPDYDVDYNDEDGFVVCGGQQVHAATREALIGEIDAAIEGDPSDCEKCYGFGVCWNNADPTSGQWAPCECGDERGHP